MVCIYWALGAGYLMLIGSYYFYSFVKKNVLTFFLKRQNPKKNEKNIIHPNQTASQSKPNTKLKSKCINNRNVVKLTCC